jgi:hypothetical protein
MKTLSECTPLQRVLYCSMQATKPKRVPLRGFEIALLTVLICLIVILII